MKILFMGETESTALQIGEILRDDESMCWHTFGELDDDFEMEEFDLAILDGTTGQASALSILI